MDESQDGSLVLSQDKHTLAGPGDLGGLSDHDLVVALDAAAAGERTALGATLRCLAEVERRGVHVDMGYRTIFDYCVLRLKMSEGAAMRRMYSARIAGKFPVLYEHLRSGSLSLSSLSRLAPHLTEENCSELLARACGARLREVETLVAELVLKEARRLPPVGVEIAQAELAFDAEGEDRDQDSNERPAPNECAPSATAPVVLAPARPPRDSVHVESPGVIRFVFRASTAFREKLELVSRLLGRRSDGRLETVVEFVLDRFLDKEDPFRRKTIKRQKASPRSRRVSRWIRDVVWRRDGGRCTFTAADGVRCEARSKIEYDHIKPWARGGVSDDPANIRLLCRTHNLHLARKAFGDRVPAARLG